jgi:hypothetical protein
LLRYRISGSEVALDKLYDSYGFSTGSGHIPTRSSEKDDLSLGILVNDIIEAFVRFPRRVIPAGTRDVIDGRIQGPVMAAVQTLINLKRRNLHHLFGEGRVIKYSFKPQSDEKTPVSRNPSDQYLREAMINTLDSKDVYFDFMVQFQTDAHKMPVEDASVVWPEKLSPFINVATIRIPAQKFAIRAQDDFARSLSFNPWHSIPEHRSLGNQNRARKRIYLETSKFRQQIGGDPRIEPTGDERFDV